MKKMKNGLSGSFAIVLASGVILSTDCLADWTYTIKQRTQFLKETFVFENLDKDDYAVAGYTSGGLELKGLVYSMIENSISWIDLKNSKMYVGLAGAYGWIDKGRIVEQPLVWDVTGTQGDAGIEIGGFVNMSFSFDLFPHVGFRWVHQTFNLSNQRYANNDLLSYINRNGNSIHSNYYMPFAGFGLHYIWKDLDIGIKYDFAYGIGFIKGLIQRRTVITDLYTGTRNSLTVRQPNLAAHSFEYMTSYKLNSAWSMGVQIGYSQIYNNVKQPIKSAHRNRLLATGQLERKQHTFGTEFIGKEYNLKINAAYKF